MALKKGLKPEETTVSDEKKTRKIFMQLNHIKILVLVLSGIKTNTRGEIKKRY